MVSLVELSACSTAEGSRMHEDVHGNFPLVVLELKELKLIEEI
jgi:hypothetical protein